MPDEQDTNRDKPLDPTHIEYWVAEAHKLKKAADLCWEADLSLQHDTESARVFGLDQALIEAADDAELELNWLYPNLVIFAIQHLAIGILLKLDPKRIIRQASRFHISSAIADCGVKIDPGLSDFIDNVENAFRWSEQSPQWSVRLSANQLQSLKRRKAHIDEISETQKQALDDLFSRLDEMAAREMAKQAPSGGEAQTGERK